MAEEQQDLTAFTVDIVAAYLSHNSLGPEELPLLISDVRSALAATRSAPTVVAETQSPAVSIRSSVKPDHIVCLEDGKRFKSLKRHLRTHHKLSPDEYRAKWGLKADYPMVAPSFSKTRSSLARTAGFGQKTSDPAGTDALEQKPWQRR